MESLDAEILDIMLERPFQLEESQFAQYFRLSRRAASGPVL